MARYHSPHPHHPFHLHVPTYFHAPHRPHMSESMRDSLWLFVALAILLGTATVVQWLFSMM
jgi:hypothetical protein